MKRKSLHDPFPETNKFFPSAHSRSNSDKNLLPQQLKSWYMSGEIESDEEQSSDLCIEQMENFLLD